MSKKKRRQAAGTPAAAGGKGRQGREGRRRGSARRPRWMGYLPWVGLVAVVVGVIVAVALLSGGTAKKGDALTVISGIGTPFPKLSAEHLAQGVKYTGAYNSVPPSSGPHWELPARCGTYREALPDEQVLHNLEHGSLVISHNIKEPEHVSHLESFALRLPGWQQWGVLRTYPALQEGEVAIAAWGVMDKFVGVDEARLRSFWNAYAHNRFSEETKAQGPIPCS